MNKIIKSGNCLICNEIHYRRKFCSLKCRRKSYKNKVKAKFGRSFYKTEHYKNRKKSSKFRVKLATPKWVNKKEIINFYKNCPIGMQVDHIVPLNGINVSGLHVPWNLQYLTPKENIKKSNRF